MGLSKDMLESRIPVLLLRYAIPSIVGMLSTAMYIVLDGIFIGHFVGADGLASVHIVMPAFSFIAALGLMISIGGGTLISIELGRRNPDLAKARFSMILTTLILISAGTALLAVTQGPAIASALGASPRIRNDVLQYMRPLAYFSFAFLGNFFFDYILRATGHPRKAMAIMVSASLANILLDALMIGLLGWGIIGAAYATGLAQLGGLLAMITVILRDVKTFRMTLAWPDGRILLRAIYNGSSEFFAEMSFGLSTLMFNLALMKQAGVLGVSAFSIVSYINVLVAFVIIGLSMSLQPLVSVNYGAGRHDRVREILKYSYIYGLIFSILSLSLVFINGTFLVSLFTSADSALRTLAHNALRTIAISFLFMCINIVSSAFFTAIEWAGTSMMISIARGIVFIFLGLNVLPRFWGIQGVWLTLPFAEIMTSILAMILISRFFRSDRTDRKPVSQRNRKG